MDFWLSAGLNAYLHDRGLTQAALPSRMSRMLESKEKALLILIEQQFGRRPPRLENLILLSKNMASRFAYLLSSEIFFDGHGQLLFPIFSNSRISAENSQIEVMEHLVREARRVRVPVAIIMGAARETSSGARAEVAAILKNFEGIDVGAPPPPQPPHALRGHGVTQPAPHMPIPYSPQQGHRPSSGIQPSSPQPQPNTQWPPPTSPSGITNYRPKRRTP